MKIEELSSLLNIFPPKQLHGLRIYNYLRNYFIKKFHSKYNSFFQSPSIKPTTIKQRSSLQSEFEHSVYQRADYTPLRLEGYYNSLFPQVGSILPETLMFSSGMSAISSISYYLFGAKKINRIALGENAYFETKWLIEDYHRLSYFNEYNLNLPLNCDVIWIEYPINCTQPHSYPFNNQLDLITFFHKLVDLVHHSSRHFYLIIDYTLFYIPFDLKSFITQIPKNLTIFLVTSLQKHRGFGLDLTNAGAITFYSHQTKKDLEYLKRVRAITGTSVTQETVWLMPPLNKELINQIIKDSGRNAQDVFRRSYIPDSPVQLYYADNSYFLTCFIFVQISPKIMKLSKSPPYFSDLLIKEIILAARRHHVILIYGTSFGFPFSRIFKNSERYQNTDSLRIAIGYDSEMNRGVDLAIVEGIKRFIFKYAKEAN